ncbi:hypothetical protein [Agromyces sp. LHK192]|uniref:hypothetical protein n=1 Tax=Agromyces sp. LHK192 TaxID=2498704 RepID=UPI001F0BC0A0|nr:hypothetical protein [Agromyces sp. LHK192]
MLIVASTAGEAGDVVVATLLVFGIVVFGGAAVTSLATSLVSIRNANRNDGRRRPQAVTALVLSSTAVALAVWCSIIAGPIVVSLWSRVWH